MTTKIFRNVLACALVVLLVSVLIVFGFTYHSYTTLALEDARRECEYVKSGIEEYGIEYLYSLDAGGRITHVLADGSVAFDSHGPVGSANHLDREEIAEALRYGEGSAVRVSETLGKNTAYYAIRLQDGNVIRTAAEHHSAFSIFLNVLQPVLVLFLAVLIFAFFIAVRLSRTLVKPINEIDLERPDDSAVFDEMKPIVTRLKNQNYKIKRQMNELSERGEEFNSITSNMSEGILLLNSRAEILSCNRSARELFGIDESDIGRSLMAAVGSHDLRALSLMALGGERGSETFKAEERTYELLATPVWRSGAVSGAVIFVIDTTEREKREELRREFTANVSHELKTPLTSISGFAELIKDGIAEGDDVKRFAGNIHKEAKRLISLVTDIIRLGQVDSGELPFDGEVSLSLICRQVTDRLSLVAEGRGVTLELRGNSASALGNRQLLEELVYNLVDNGIKYNKEGGTVKIITESSRSGAVLTVKDDGIGIPASDRDRVFERFYRVDKSHSRSIGGTGLGLSIVKHIAQYHGARIELDSEQGVGTEIRVYFPRVTDRNDTAQKP